MVLKAKNWKYLQYAIGELVLVVLGILIALQVNNWNETRKNRDLEKNLLAKLKNEYQQNLEEINSKILIRERMMSSIKYLLTYSAEYLDSTRLESDSIQFHIRRTTTRPTLDPVEGVTSEILNSGKLNLIQNEKLALFLSNWSGMKNKVVEEERDLVLYTTQNYYTYRIQNYNLFLLSSDTENDLAKVYYIDETVVRHSEIPNKNDITKSKMVVECSRYLQDPIIRNYLLRIYKTCNTTNNQSTALRNEIQSILGSIDHELN